MLSWFTYDLSFSHTTLFSVYEFFNTEYTILSNFYLLILYKILNKIVLLLLTQNINKNSNYIDMVYYICGKMYSKIWIYNVRELLVSNKNHIFDRSRKTLYGTSQQYITL